MFAKQIDALTFYNRLTDTAYPSVPTRGNHYQLPNGKTGAVAQTATRADLIFGSNTVLRTYAQLYAQYGAKQKFVQDFATAWTKMMNADRFDLA